MEEVQELAFVDFGHIAVEDAGLGFLHQLLHMLDNVVGRGELFVANPVVIVIGGVLIRIGFRHILMDGLERGVGAVAGGVAHRVVPLTVAVIIRTLVIRLFWPILARLGRKIA